MTGEEIEALTALSRSRTEPAGRVSRAAMLLQFTLQGDNDRVKQALTTIAAGTKKSSEVNVSTSPATTNPNLTTFTVVGWTSHSRGINNPYDLVFRLRNPDTIIKKGQAKAVWLQICESAVKGEDIGKCDKDNDD